MTVKDAFKLSAGWAYIEIAKRISREIYHEHLSANQYGNLELNESSADCWNFGPMKISPKNQIEFLIKVYRGEAHFNAAHLDLLKKLMVSNTSDSTIVRSKTGWTRTERNNIGWWVGYAEHGCNVYFFATRITRSLSIPSDDFARLRKEITNEVFMKQFGINLPID